MDASRIIRSSSTEQCQRGVKKARTEIRRRLRPSRLLKPMVSSYGNTTVTLNRDQVQRKTIRAFPASEQAPKQCDNALQDDYATLYVLLRISPVRKVRHRAPFELPTESSPQSELVLGVDCLLLCCLKAASLSFLRPTEKTGC